MRKGISVIEILIVIIVISVLASMMFFSSTDAVEAARATAIINNMKKMKEAVSVWYMDNRDRFVFTSDGFHIRVGHNPDGTWKGGKVATKKKADGSWDGDEVRLHDYFYLGSDELSAYFDASGVSFNDYREGDSDWEHKSRDRYYASTGNYSVYFGYGNRKIYVVAKISDHNSGSEAVLRQKLKARAKSAGLLVYDFKAGSNAADNKDWVYDGEHANVLMEVVDLSPWSKP